MWIRQRAGLTRANRSDLTIFVNGRWSDRGLSAAITPGLSRC
jgi:hypothetical protein